MVGVGYCQGSKAVKKRLSSGSESSNLHTIYSSRRKKKVGQRAVVKRKSLRSFLIAFALTAQWLSKIAAANGCCQTTCAKSNTSRLYLVQFSRKWKFTET